MRILHVVSHMGTGGIEAMLMDLYRNIDRSRFDFDFVQHGKIDAVYNNEIRSLGASIYECPKFTWKTMRAYGKWWTDFFENHDYDAVHCHIRSTAYLILRQARRHKLTTIAHAHAASEGSGPVAWLKRCNGKKIERYADWLIGCSAKAGQWLFGKEAIDSERFHVILNPVDLKRFAPNEKKRLILRTSLNVNDRMTLLVNVGRMVPLKNQQFLIRLIAKLPEKFHLLLVGDGLLRDKLNRNADKRGLKDRIHFIGDRRDVEAWLSAGDMFLFPSLAEGLGISLLEAQASGLQSIVSEHIPHEAIITDKVKVISLEREDDWISSILAHKVEWPRIVNADDFERGQVSLARVVSAYEYFYDSIDSSSS